MALGETPYSIVYNELFNDANGPWLAMIQTAIFEGKVDEAIAAAQVRFEQIMAPK
jgi:multiple sugar transport system substrate-binding protein